MFCIFKRLFDIISAFIVLIIISPLLLVIAAAVKYSIGSPVLFIQERSGMGQKSFLIKKFRTMTNETDSNGDLLPDEKRQTKIGKFLRSSSLEGNDIIRQTTKSLENKGFREVSPIHFFNGCNLISNDFRVMIA